MQVKHNKLFYSQRKGIFLKDDHLFVLISIKMSFTLYIYSLVSLENLEGIQLIHYLSLNYSLYIVSSFID